MKPFLQQYKIHVTIGIFVLVFLPVSFFLWKHLRFLIAEDIDKKQQLQVTQEIQKATITAMPQLRTQVQRIEQNRDKLNILFDNSGNATVELYAQIERIAALLGHEDITFTVETYKAPQKDKPQRKKKSNVKNPKKDTQKKKKTADIAPSADNFLYLHIKTISTFNEAIAFLEKIDNLPYLSDVLAFDIVAYETPQRSARDQTTSKRPAKNNLVESHFYIVFYAKEKATPQDNTAQPSQQEKNPATNQEQK